MKEFRINEGTLKLVQEKLTVLRDTTNSRGEHLELSTLLKVLEKLIQIVEPSKPAWDCPQAFTDSLLKKYKKNFEKQYLESWTNNLNSERVKFTLTDAQTSTSSLVGKSVHHPSNGLLGVITQELLNGEVRVKWSFCDNEYNWSKENLGL